MRLINLLLMLTLVAAPGALAQEREHDEHREREHAEHRDHDEHMDEQMREDAHAAAMVIHQLFDAMRAKDTTAMRALFHESARLQRAGRNREGALTVSTTPIDRFIEIVGNADGYLDEKIWDVRVRLDADLATVWNKYAFYFNEQFSHCGVDAFQLARLDDGWKIIQITDTQRRENCEMPPEHDDEGHR